MNILKKRKGIKLIQFIKNITTWKKITILPIFLGIILGAYGSTEDKSAVTRGHIELIGSAVEAYKEDHFKAPEAFSINELAKLLEPGYIKNCPLKDAWGNKFYYIARNIQPKMGKMDSQYWIGSGGTTGKFEGFLKCMTKAPLNENDIIYSDGEFKSILGTDNTREG